MEGGRDLVDGAGLGGLLKLLGHEGGGGGEKKKRAERNQNDVSHLTAEGCLEDSPSSSSKASKEEKIPPFLGLTRTLALFWHLVFRRRKLRVNFFPSFPSFCEGEQFPYKKV